MEICALNIDIYCWDETMIKYIQFLGWVISIMIIDFMGHLLLLISVYTNTSAESPSPSAFARPSRPDPGVDRASEPQRRAARQAAQWAGCGRAEL